MKVVIVFNDHPRTHLGCWNCHVFNSLLRTIAVNFDEACLVPAGTVLQTIGLVFVSLRQ
jgi:hypothetical protein